MVDELLLAFFATLVISCVVFFPLKLQGTWVLFWLTYYCTLSIGIGEAFQGFTPQEALMWALDSRIDRALQNRPNFANPDEMRVLPSKRRELCSLPCKKMSPL